MRKSFLRGLMMGVGIAAGVMGAAALAITVGTVKTWTTGEALTADDLNTSLGNLKKAIESLPNWTKSGANAIYTDGNVGIGTATPANRLTLSDGLLQLHRSSTAPATCDASNAGSMYFDTEVKYPDGTGSQDTCICRNYLGKWHWNPTHAAGINYCD